MNSSRGPIEFLAICDQVKSRLCRKEGEKKNKRGRKEGALKEPSKRKEKKEGAVKIKKKRAKRGRGKNPPIAALFFFRKRGRIEIFQKHLRFNKTVSKSGALVYNRFWQMSALQKKEG